MPPPTPEAASTSVCAIRGQALVALCLWLAFASGGNALAEDPWADEVADYHAIDPNLGFDTPEKTLGEPVGGGTLTPNNSSLHSVGRPGPAPGSYIILKFNTPVTDDPDNPMGLDCIVFGNVSWVGGSPQRKWVEPGLIEISEDVNGNGQADDPWYVLRGSRFLDRAVLPEGIPNPTPPLAGSVLNPNGNDLEYDWGYAELNPTQKKYLDNYVRPDDPNEVGLTPRSGGGDAFDIASAVPVDASGNPQGITQFHFIRINACIDMPDGLLGFITPEIDAVADVAPDVDSDGDGILDEYETRVAGTDPARRENTVLALEIPPEDGASPAGAELGRAHDGGGNAIALYSSGERSGQRHYNCIVDILKPADPGGSIPDLIKSGAVREFQSTEPDFQAAQVQDAEITIAYTAPEITGLDEPGLQPFRYVGGPYTQDGIYAVMKDTQDNLLTFRTQFPGVFVLASTEGEGDMDSPPGGVILHAVPPQGVVGDPGTEAVIASDPILLPDDSPAPEGMPFTVWTTLGTITTPDEDPGEPDIQVLVSGGMITFAVQSSMHAGAATITAVSLDGLTYGQLGYDFLAGPPVGPVEVYLVDPNTTAPGPVAFITGVVTDEYGNPLDTDAYLTLIVIGGTPTTADADPAQPGHQIGFDAGIASFSVRVSTDEKHDTETVIVALYADAALTQLLGEQSFVFDVVEMDLNVLLPLCVMTVLVALWALRGRPLRAE